MSSSEKPQKVRLFFGMPLPEELLEAALEAQRVMQAERVSALRALRWLSAANLHLTLKFMGWVQASDVSELSRELSALSTGLGPIAVQAEGLGAFPKPARARVLVLRLADPEGSLDALARELELLAERFGVPREERAFKAHVTLARLTSPSDVRALIQAVDWQPQSSQLRRVNLYQSTLLASGSVYTALCSADLRV